MPFSLADLEQAAAAVYRSMSPTPQYRWPLLCQRLGTEVWVKHENHTPVGAFKIRGGLVYFDRLRQREPEVRGVISATRGNHGQSVAFAAARAGLHATIVVPEGNSLEKNAAMRALGAELIEHGEDFQASLEHAERLAVDKGLHLVPSFHPDLVAGVASYTLEFLRGCPPLDQVYVPVGLGSGICAMVAARNALGLNTRIIGVVSSHAPAYSLSFAQRRPVSHPVATRTADGVACRTPVPSALEVMWSGVERVVEVDDAGVERAMRAIFTDTHNAAEGAGAITLAAAMQERQELAGKRIGLVITGGNVDRVLFARILAGD